MERKKSLTTLLILPRVLAEAAEPSRAEAVEPSRAEAAALLSEAAAEAFSEGSLPRRRVQVLAKLPVLVELLLALLAAVEVPR